MRSVTSALVGLLALGLAVEADEFSVEFNTDKPLGMKLDQRSKAVLGFVRVAEEKLPAEASLWIREGDRLVAVNERRVDNWPLQRVVAAIKAADLPKILTFDAARGENRTELMQPLLTRPGGLQGIQGWLRLEEESIESAAFRFVAAEFGGPSVCNVMPLVVPEPAHGCMALRDREQVRDALVVLERGVCSFANKAWMMQEHGARAVLVVNNDIDAFPMPRDSQLRESVDLPVGMVSSKVGRELRRVLRKHRVTGHLAALRASLITDDHFCLAPDERTQQDRGRRLSRALAAVRVGHAMPSPEQGWGRGVGAGVGGPSQGGEATLAVPRAVLQAASEGAGRVRLYAKGEAPALQAWDGVMEAVRSGEDLDTTMAGFHWAGAPEAKRRLAAASGSAGAAHSDVASLAQHAVASGEYVVAEFGGPTPVVPVEMVAASPLRACDLSPREQARIKGKAVLVERGECSFGHKAKLLAAAGAAVMVVVNSQPGCMAMLTSGAEAGSSPALASRDAWRPQALGQAGSGSGSGEAEEEEDLVLDLPMASVMLTRSAGQRLRAALNEAEASGQRLHAVFDGDAAIPARWTELMDLLDESKWPRKKTGRKKTYIKLARLHHPDKSTGSQDRFELLQYAFKRANYLADPKREPFVDDFAV